jgi:hypothetical protein
MAPQSNRRLSRRRVLKTGVAALGGGAAWLDGTSSAQTAQPPGIPTGSQTGRTFRGLVRHDTTLDVQELRLLPMDARQVVIRSLAVAPCYTRLQSQRRTAHGVKAALSSSAAYT